jgi:tetratricopeptide (TPR) repeat protein
MQHLGCFLTLTGLVLGSVLPQQVVLAQSRVSGAGNMNPTVGAPLANLTQPGSDGGETVERGWYLSGKVLMDDGSAPPENATIQRVCGGTGKPVAYTDSKGRFSFQVGQSLDVLPDASVDSGEEARVALMAPIGNSTHEGRLFGSSGSRQLAGCELMAVLPGYRSDKLELGQRKYMDNPDVGSIVLHRLGNVEGTAISATSYEAPHEARKAYEKGLDAEKRQKWPDAQEQFEKAVGVYPKYAAGWFELGNTLQRQGNGPKARDAFRKSVEADRRFLKPYLPLAEMAFEEKNWAETVDLTTTLTRLDPVDYPLAYLFNAIASASLGKVEVAEKSAREAIKVDASRQFPRAEYVLGLILVDKHDYDGALALLRSYIQRAPNAPDAARIKMQISQVENLARAQPQPVAAQH